MPRPVLLFSGPWADLPLDGLVSKAAAWGYHGFELCCWGDHLEVQRGLSDDGYCPARLDLLARSDLQIPVVANHKVGQAVSDPIDRRHHGLVPDYVWGDGNPAGVQQRAAEEMKATFRLAERLGAGVVSGFTGSPIWGYVAGYPAPRPDVVDRPPSSNSLPSGTQSWMTAGECGVRFACEVHTGQLAFDLYSAELILDALGGSGGVRVHLRPQPPPLARSRPGRIPPPIPRPDLSCPCQGRSTDAQRSIRHTHRILAKW
jgi:sugar phosphate isomerase/epimerase